MPVSARDIVHQYCKGQMSGRPEYYSGRGNNLGDLNSRLLEMIHGGIKAEVGAPAARAFVNMVHNLKDASATGFLVALYRLENAAWVYRGDNPRNEAEALAETVSNAMNRGDAEEAFAAGQIGILAIMSRGNTPAGNNYSITGEFLQQHKDELDTPLNMKATRGDYFSPWGDKESLAPARRTPSPSRRRDNGAEQN